MFETFTFTSRQLQNFIKAALKDYHIASTSKIPDVTFRFCYDALLKIAIAVCAFHGLRVKARQGHHIELISKCAALLKDPDIEVIGNTMRQKKNWDLYSGGAIISEKEAKEYIRWLRGIIENATKYMENTSKKQPKLTHE